MRITCLHTAASNIAVLEAAAHVLGKQTSACGERAMASFEICVDTDASMAGATTLVTAGTPPLNSAIAGLKAAAKAAER
ncbi:hypothetical protein SAMN04490179_3956 [Pseudomonas antarctica]|uniref:Uncharacterized protein n=2 Tax=Pseudomonas antarctica TaxID=219572 RepID=A0A1H0AX52_9PSED|nr:hypothetical protein PSAN_45000 [Pseudomonas antarctica]SDN38044.1 hypothetical protein SAMN04490179_3956 [Pseudomonas antarctica]